MTGNRRTAPIPAAPRPGHRHERRRVLIGLAALLAGIVLDHEGDATVAWTPRVFPSTVLVGRDGGPVQIVVGELDWGGGEADALLAPLVAASART